MMYPISRSTLGSPAEEIEIVVDCIQLIMIWVGVEDAAINKGVSAAPVHRTVLRRWVFQTCTFRLGYYVNLTPTLGNMQTSISFLNNEIEHL